MRSVLAGLRRLVLPWGAGAGQPRIVMGTDIPPNLKAYYTLAGYDIYACIIFYDSHTDNQSYTYMALVQASPAPNLAIGTVTAGTVRETFFVSPFNVDLVDVRWMDPTTGDDTNGAWVTLTPLNGWVARAGFQGFCVKRLPSPSQSCMIVGSFNPAGVNTDGTLLCVLPAQFIPTRSVGVPIQTSATVAGGQSPVLEIENTGNCRIYGVRGAFMGFSFIYSLDA